MTSEKIVYENLKSYKYELCKEILNVEFYDNNANNDKFYDEKTHYYIIDCPGSDAFGHWILETFIFIELLIELNKNIDNIKILTSNTRKYVKSFLNFFNIKNEVVYTIENYNNICYFPKIYSINETNIIEDTYYNYHLNYYINYIKNNIIDLNYHNKVVLLPRNSIDNYVSNDRKINNIDNIKELVINNGGTVIDTYNLNNIFYQFSILNNSDNIILDYGSSLFVNAMFLNNKNIYVFDDYNYFYLHNLNKSYMSNILIEKILANNNVKIISTNDLNSIQNIFN